MKLYFYIDKAVVKAMPEEEYEAVEMAQDGEIRLYKMRPLIARFMADENGKPMTRAAAMRLLGKLPLEEWGDVVKQFVAAISEIAVPNPNGGSSKPPSEANTPTSESPAGSQP